MLSLHQQDRPDTQIEHSCSAGVGAVVLDDPGTSEDDILKWADAAMYRAKEAGRNQIWFH